jgi:hypothetical protein
VLSNSVILGIGSVARLSISSGLNRAVVVVMAKHPYQLPWHRVRCAGSILRCLSFLASSLNEGPPNSLDDRIEAPAQLPKQSPFAPADRRDSL